MTTLIVPALISVLGVYRTAVAQPSERVLDAIKQVESGGVENPPDGDGGKAIGTYQIHKAYFIDAQEKDKSLAKYKWEECRTNPELSKRVVIAYLTAFAGKNASDEDCARVHNGGRNIMKKKGGKAWNATTKYWQKVKKVLGI